MWPHIDLVFVWPHNSVIAATNRKQKMNSKQANEMMNQGATLHIGAGPSAPHILRHPSFRKGSRKLSSVTASALRNLRKIDYRTIPRDHE